MKFVMLEDSSTYMNNERVILCDTFVDKRHSWKNTISLGYLLRIADFDENYEFNIIDDTESVQLRPKAIYKTNKGYYKKLDNKRIYFNEEEVKEIEEAIIKYKNYLEEKGE